MVILKKLGLWTLTLISSSALVFLVLNSSADAYLCRTAACEAARANMEAYQDEAEKASENADSISAVITQLNAEINAIAARISANEVIAEDLKTQIAATELKLDQQQVALAGLLADMHFDKTPDTITILAGSNTISELAEKETRQTTLKEQIAASAKEIKKTKESLEDQKAEIERIIESQNAEKATIALKRNQQASLKAQYEQDANEANALANYFEEQLKLLAYTPPSTGSGWGTRTYAFANTYPYKNSCPRDNNRYSAYGGNVCQCTSYVRWKALEKWGTYGSWSGHAYNYVNAYGYVASTKTNIYVDRNPEAYTIAVTPATSESPYGHVMWVESVNSDGTINLTEYNVSWSRGDCYAGNFCARVNVGTSNMYFVHFSK